MKHLIASVSIAALTALSAGAVHAQTTETNASTPTTAAAQGGRDQAVYRDKDGMRVRAGTPGAVLDPKGLTVEEIDAFGKTDSAFESEEYRALAYPDGRGSKNYAAVQPIAGDNGADPVTTAAAQGGRDGSVYRDKNGMMVSEGTPGAALDPKGWTVEELEAAKKTDSAFESAEFRALAYPEGRGSKNYADVQPVADDNGADPVRTGAAQGGRDEAVFKSEDGTATATE